MKYPYLPATAASSRSRGLQAVCRLQAGVFTVSIKSEKLLSLCRPEKVEIELVFRIQTCFEYNIVHFLQIYFSLAYYRICNSTVFFKIIRT